jgi:hypothetical protein
MIERKFDTRVEMISWVLDVSYKLGFVVVIAKRILIHRD